MVRRLLLAHAVLGLGCRPSGAPAGRGQDGGPPSDAPVEVRALSESSDPATLSDAVRRIARETSCARALEALETRVASLPGRVTIGLVEDAIDAGGGRCDGAGRGAAGALGRATLAASRPDEALAALQGASDVAAIRWRRAELLLKLGRDEEAIGELRAGLGREDDPRARAELAHALIRAGRAADALEVVAKGKGEEVERARIAALAAAGRIEEAVKAIEAAPLDRRRSLARAAVKVVNDAEAMVRGAGVEILAAVAERVEEERGAAVAEAAWGRALAAAPDDPTILERVADARAAAGDLLGAVGAWDRMAVLAPVSEKPRVAAVALLVRAGRSGEARARARRLAADARRARDADALTRASAVASAADDRAAALALAREAAAARPDDGRLLFLVADRLEDAGQRDAAIEVLFQLLLCGAHQRAWHRHEVAARLVDLARAAGKARDLTARLLRPSVTCKVPEEEDLRRWTAKMAEELAR